MPVNCKHIFLPTGQVSHVLQPLNNTLSVSAAGKYVVYTKIVNDMDTTDWSPSIDKYLDVKYDLTYNAAAGKLGGVERIVNGKDTTVIGVTL